MYDNIGRKIKSLAKFIFVLESIASFFAGILIYALSNKAALTFIIMICGPLIAWISSWTLYAFGELVEDVGVIRRSFQKENIAQQNSTTTSSFEIITTPPKQSHTHGIFCKVCGADITFDKSTCHVCDSKIPTPTNNASTIVDETNENDICKICGADITLDTSVCHVCKNKIT